jgi:hypothetical protein
VVLKEGWNFFPLYPFVFSFLLVNVEKINQDLQPQEVRTPDKAQISVKSSITWKPGIKGDSGSLITYLNSGGEAGVKGIIHSIFEDRIKTWAGSNKEGPSSWMEAQAMKDDVHVVLAKSILGDVLTSIPMKYQGVPTSTWMRFLDTPQSEPTEYDAIPRNGWAYKTINPDGSVAWGWTGLEVIFNGYSQEEQEELRNAIADRRADVRKIREGKGSFGDESLGITIFRFSVNEVKVIGKVADAAEKEEAERRERAADKMEIGNVSDRIKELQKELPGMSVEHAARIVQTERGKINQSVVEVIGASTSLGHDILGALGINKMPGVGASTSGGNPQNNCFADSERESGKPPKQVNMTTEEARAFFKKQFGYDPGW